MQITQTLGDVIVFGSMVLQAAIRVAKEQSKDVKDEEIANLRLEVEVSQPTQGFVKAVLVRNCVFLN